MVVPDGGLARASWPAAGFFERGNKKPAALFLTS
jgi:hypothetical protein